MSVKSLRAGSPVRQGRAEPALVPPSALEGSVQIWLVRHGQTTWSESGRHTGRSDIPLTPFGEQQAAALAHQFGSLRPALVLSSPRARALRTAELAGLRVDGIDDDLSEWDYGTFEGLTTAEIRQTYPGWTIWTGPVPEGETPVQLMRRADRVLSRALAGAPSGPVVLFTHGHIGRVLGARWVGLAVADGARFALATAAVCVLGAEHGLPVIDRWNQPNPAVDAALPAKLEASAPQEVM